MKGASELAKLNRELDSLLFVVSEKGGAQRISEPERRALRGEIDRLIERLADMRNVLSRK
jgi:hypothetical protein